MAKGFEPPPDLAVIIALHEADRTTTAMALHLVQGEVCDAESLTEDEAATVSVLHLILDYCQEEDIRDIHKIIDMPMPMLMRWNRAWETAMPQEDVPSVGELEQMFEA